MTATPQPYGPQQQQYGPTRADAPWSDTQKSQFLKEHGYGDASAELMVRHADPSFINQGSVKAPPVSKPKPYTPAGAGMAQNGLAVSPDAVEKLRSKGIPDDAIADEMAKSSSHFAIQLKKIRTKFGGDPAATTAYLNTRFYGDTQFNPVSQTTGNPVARPKSTNPVAKALDYIYTVGKQTTDTSGIFGQGGVMDQYNNGELNAAQAAYRTAGNIYHKALTPVLDPFADANKAAWDATGGTQLIQKGIQGVKESQLGQDVAPFVQEKLHQYNDLPAGSPVRDLAVAGQAGLDTLGVVAAQGEVDMGKRAATQSMRPWQSIRHPYESGKYVLTGAKPAAIAAASAEAAPRQLTGVAKEAVDKGMDEKFMTFAAEQNPDTRAVMAKMTEAAHGGGKVLGGTVAHKEILGGQMLDPVAYVLDQKKIAGRALGAMKGAVADVPVDLTEEYSTLLTTLRNKGAVIDGEGVITALAGASDDNIPLLQKTLDFLRPDNVGNVVKTGKEIDMWRTKMFQEMNSARAKLQPSAAGQPVFGLAEDVTNKMRRASLVKMAAGNQNLISMNDAYEELATQSSKFLKAIGYKGELDVESITANQLRAGEVSLRQLGNASAQTRDAFQGVLETAQKYGRQSTVDNLALVKYADALEDVFPVTPTRSLGGQVSRATRDAVGNLTEDIVTQGPRAGITRMAVDRVLGKIEKMRGMTPENRFKLLMDVLNAPPEAQFFSVAQKALPPEVVGGIDKGSLQGVTAGDVQPLARKELAKAGAAITVRNPESPQ